MSTSSSRRAVLAAIGAAAVSGTTRRARAAGALRPVSMRLDWVYQGPNIGFITARDKGLYEKVGLDVDVGVGKGSGTTAQLIASKAAQFGFADGFVVGNGVAKGLNIRTVGAVYRRNPAAVIVLADSNIKTPKDLEGQSIAITTGSAQFQQWPAFAKGAGIDASKVHVVNIEPASAPPALITGRIPAIAGFAQGYVPSVEIRGHKEVRVFWYADYGVDVVSNGIIVHNDLLKEDPALVRAFVGASIRGFIYARQHPDEAVAIVKKYSDATDNAITRREMELSWQTWVTPNTRGKPLGWSSDKDWDATVKTLKQYGGVEGPLSATQLYTNDFVAMDQDLVPPQP